MIENTNVLYSFLIFSSLVEMPNKDFSICGFCKHETSCRIPSFWKEHIGIEKEFGLCHMCARRELIFHETARVKPTRTVVMMTRSTMKKMDVVIRKNKIIRCGVWDLGQSKAIYFLVNRRNNMIVREREDRHVNLSRPNFRL